VFWILPVVVIAARELIIQLYRTFVGAKGVSVPATKLAKWKTFAQQVAVGFALLPLTASRAAWAWQASLWIAVGLTVYTGAEYLVKAQRVKATVEAVRA
jgi:CDP-diacylglycerol--glycerol-3-phosphate 3-phosphatidyltransferase